MTWTCKNCGQPNFMNKDHCSNCGKSRNYGARLIRTTRIAKAK